MNSGCKDCTERYVGCHSTCENYKLFREELDARKKQITEAKTRHAEHNQHRDKQVKKALKRKYGKV